MHERKKCTVSGGAGFIGSNLTGYLLENGYEVVCLDNLITGNKRNISRYLDHPGFFFKKCDVSEKLPDEVTEIVEGSSLVFHLASPASPPKYQKYAIETMKVNSFGTMNMLELALKNDSRFLLASTSEVYGNPLEHPQRETYWGNVNTVGIRSCYDESKRFAESLSMEYYRKFNAKVRIVRIFNTYGPNMEPDDGRVISNFINQRLKGKNITVYGNGDQTRSFCYITDMVRGIYAVISKEGIDGEVFNLGNPDEKTVLQIGKMITRLIPKGTEKVDFLPLPKDDPEKRKPDIGKAMKILGWKPEVNLSEGLKLTIEYFSRV